MRQQREQIKSKRRETMSIETNASSATTNEMRAKANLANASGDAFKVLVMYATLHKCGSERIHDESKRGK